MRCGLLGEHLTHSFSPLIHAKLGNYEYRLYEKKPEEIEDFLRNGDFDGINVTIPYKKAVIPYCTELSEAARDIGSVNTIIRRKDGSLYGDNTDFYGFKYLLEKEEPGKVLVLGSGGSSLMVQAVLRGMKDVVVISRQGENNYQNLDKHYDAKLIINTTPLGMYPQNGISPIEHLHSFDCSRVIDLIYNPSRTKLLMDAEDLGMSAVNGLTMLTAQAKRSAELFTGMRIPDYRIGEITGEIEKFTKNIALIGMPGCGKSGIGLKIADMTHRKFCDTDIFIEEKYKKSIPDIIEQEGLTKFREIETAVLEEVTKNSGYVIATGGGVVTQDCNRRLLRQNSVIVFLDRDISQLPIEGRPLSQQMGAEALAAERLPLYKQWADFSVPVCGISRTAEDVLIEYSTL